MREHSCSDIESLLGIKSAKDVFQRVSRLIRNPACVDSENVLVDAYINTYILSGKAAARKEIARRIQLAKEIRRLRELYLDRVRHSSYPPFYD